ncbi:MAG: HsdM family class I SAM-dependent methyltransferase [Acidiferrobacterales bacterium]
MATKKHKETNEQEFQGRVTDWLNGEIKRCHHSHLDKATQEKPDASSGKRHDVVVWEDRALSKAILTIELKTPKTSISDPTFFNDALDKAQRRKAPLFCIWNMQRAEIYLTSATGEAPPTGCVREFDASVPITKVEDWLTPSGGTALEQMTRQILDAAVFVLAGTGEMAISFDSEVFVGRLEGVIHRLRGILHADLQKQIKSNKKFRAKVNAIAAAQGFAGFVDDIDLALAGQLAYRFAGQVLFYFALRRKNASLPALAPDRKKSLAPQLRHHWDLVRRFDYEALYGIDDVEAMVPLSRGAEALLHELIDMLAHYDWAALADDVLGFIFERLIPREEQILLGQFYTPKPVADLLTALTIDGESPLVLDPGCGSGTFLMSAYDYYAKVQGKSHTEILPKIWGFDLSTFATELASINLYRQDLSSFDNFPRIVPGSFFDRSVGESIEFPPPKPPVTGWRKLKVPIPEFDVIVANPPYLRSQNQDDLDSDYRNVLFAAASRCGVAASPKTDLFAFFLFHAFEFLKPGGRVGFVIPASWMSADYGVAVQRFLLSKMRLLAIVTSEAESLFSQVDVNTVLLVAEKLDKTQAQFSRVARFITIKKPLATIAPTGAVYWNNILNLAAAMEAADEDIETDDYRVKAVSLDPANDLVLTAGINWGRYLRAPLSYFAIFKDDGSSVPLEDIAEIGIGFKSLQNDFFYVNDGVVSTYGIESQFLNPIFTLKDFDAAVYVQKPAAAQMVFTCAEAEGDLKGTGALKYIRAMARRAASQKKQSDTTQRRPDTIAEVLEKQGGRYWYAPKAAQNAARVWLRKGIGGTFAPFITKDPIVVDQRCNFAVGKGISDDELAAVLTSSVAALSVEINGSMSMGGGVLEAPTTKLRTYPVPDIRLWDDVHRKELVRLAKAVWKKSKPVDWSAGNTPPSELVALDAHVLQHIGAGISTDDLYRDLTKAVEVRYRLAKDKTGKQTKRKSESVKSVAASVASKVRPLLDAKLFPESMTPAGAHVEHFDSAGMGLASIELHPMMGQTEIHLETKDGVKTAKAWPEPVAEIIVRAILLGRAKFDFPIDGTFARPVITELDKWVTVIRNSLDDAVSASAAGSGYEEAVRADVYSLLGIHPVSLEKPLPRRIDL